MGLHKYATSLVISAEIAGDGDLRKTAQSALGSSEWVYDEGLYKLGHRADFSGVERRPGYLYVRNRAISSRTNDNWDTWPAEEIADTTPGFGYLTFIGKPVFVEHANDNHRRTRGVNIAVALHNDHTPQGHPDTWVEVLKEIDPIAYPKLAKAILTGRVSKTSMGADVGYSVCSKCGNLAYATTEYCKHIPVAKGARYEVPNQKTGSRETRIVTEICRKIAFFEDTFIVTTPADPTAFILGLEGEGVQKNGSLHTRPEQDFWRQRILIETGNPYRWQGATKAQHQALKEITLPPRVDTLSHDVCPTCGSENSFVGDRCSVCNGIKPPAGFMDPDTSVAPKIQDIVDAQLGDQDPTADVAGIDADQSPDLICDNCGNTFHSAESQEEKGNPYFAPAAQVEPEATELDDDEMDMAQDSTKPGPPDEEEDQDEEIPPGDEEAPGDDQEPPDAEDEAEVPADADEDQGDDQEIPAAEEEEDQIPPEGTTNAEVQTGETGADQLDDVAMEDEAGEEDTGYQAGAACPACGQGELRPMTAEEQLEASNEVDPEDADEIEDEDATQPGAVPGDDDDGEGFPPGDQEAEDDPDQDDEDEDDEDESGPPEDEDEEQDEDAPPRRKGAALMDPKEEAAKKDPVRSAINTQAARIHELHETVSAMQEDRQKMLGAFRRQSSVLRQAQALIASLQVRCEAAERQVAHIASAAGQEDAIVAIGKVGYQRVAKILSDAGLLKEANPANPAQPIAEPGSEAPVITEQQAMQPSARDDVTQLGATPMTDVSADATIAVDQPYGVYADTPVGANRVDVTAPVAGTETQRPPNETIIPVDVRIGDPDNPQPAFPWTMGPVGAPGQPIPPGPSVGNPSEVRAAASKRAYATIHLARLQVAAGIARGDELEIAASLDATGRSDQSLQDEISTLSKVVAARNTQVVVPAVEQPTRRLVPRSAAAVTDPQGNELRAVPSLGTAMANVQAPRGTAAGSPGEDEMAFI